ncbi:MAG: hypothetical protein AAF714_00275 [Pseudomonadota bacterium]
MKIYCGLRPDRPWLDRATLAWTESSFQALGGAVGRGMRRRGVRHTEIAAKADALDATFVIGAGGQMLSRSGTADELIASSHLLRMREVITR